MISDLNRGPENTPPRKKRSRRSRSRNKWYYEQRDTSMNRGAENKQVEATPPNVSSTSANSGPQAAQSNIVNTSRRPRKLTELALELRAIDEGWLEGAPADMQARVRDKLLSVMTDRNCPQQLRLRAATALSSVLAGARENIKTQAALTVRSMALNEVYEPPAGEAFDIKTVGPEVSRRWINSTNSPEEMAVVITIMKRIGMVVPPEYLEATVETGSDSAEKRC